MINFLVCSALLVAFFSHSVQGQCSPLCGTGVYTHAGTCQSTGRCLCFWGWTGPNAVYTTNNKILADYCRIPCHYTPDYKNPECVNSNHTGGECKVPSSTTPWKPCDPKCGNPPYQGRGQCLSNGRCLCWWGWTGPSACYIEDGTYRNRLIADYCFAPCHYTPYVRNPKCLNGSWDGEGVGKTIEKTPVDEVQKTKVPCDPLCSTGVYRHAGTCQPDGRCLCAYGWTGPHAQYTAGNRILADYCRVPCHYTHDYENPECVNSNHTGDECKVPDSITPTKPCDPRCGQPPYYGKGQCLSNGRCLCWWGWTGPNACYVEGGNFKNRLIADYCVTACHYTHVVRNATCLNGTWPDGKVITREKKVADNAPVQQAKCDPLCGTGVYTHAGACQKNGRCLCFWGWTGPNAAYTTNNKILADYCRIPCHYTHDYANPECVNSKHTKHKCVVPSKSDPKVPCDQRCGNPPNHGKGLCLRNGRCLCWWGWTGPHACYIDDRYFHNRIIADYCEKPCHYTHDVRNAKCVNFEWTETEIDEREMGTGQELNKDHKEKLHV